MNEVFEVFVALGLVLLAALLAQNFSRMSRAVQALSTGNQPAALSALKELRLGSALAIGAVLFAIPLLYLDRFLAGDVLDTAEAAGSAALLATAILGLVLSRRASRILRQS